MTKYFKLPLNNNELEEIGIGIRNGKNVIFPTDTVYGIGTNALDDNAVKKIFEVKGRPNNKPLIILIDNINKLNNIINEPNEIEKKLMDIFWPGPLTIIFNLKEDNKIANSVSCGSKTIGIRLTNSKISCDLIKYSGVPIVAPSANMSGSDTGINIDIIRDTFDNKIDYIIDGGNCINDVTSTLVRVVDGKVEVLREGKISKKDIDKYFN